jgi:hypothetical protein
MNDEYEAALARWKKEGGNRPHKRPDGIPTRNDLNWHSEAEVQITCAMLTVEQSGGSRSLTEAVNCLSKARDCVADHVEGIE